MEFLKLAKERYSVRQYSNKPVEDEKLAMVLEAGRVAPTAANKQPQRIYVLKTPSEIKKLHECTRYDFHSPIVLIIAYDKTASWKRKYDGHDGGETDASIVATHMMLQAWELGLGTCWVGSFDPVKVKELFAFPESFEPVALFPLGYPSSDAKPIPLHYSRNALLEGVNLFTK